MKYLSYNKSQIRIFWPLAYLKMHIAHYSRNLFSQAAFGCLINHKIGVFLFDNHKNFVIIICQK